MWVSSNTGRQRRSRKCSLSLKLASLTASILLALPSQHTASAQLTGSGGSLSQRISQWMVGRMGLGGLTPLGGAGGASMPAFGPFGAGLVPGLGGFGMPGILGMSSLGGFFGLSPFSGGSGGGGGLLSLMGYGLKPQAAHPEPSYLPPPPPPPPPQSASSAEVPSSGQSSSPPASSPSSGPETSAHSSSYAPSAASYPTSSSSSSSSPSSYSSPGASSQYHSHETDSEPSHSSLHHGSLSNAYVSSSHGAHTSSTGPGSAGYHSQPYKAHYSHPHRYYNHYYHNGNYDGFVRSPYPSYHRPPYPNGSSSRGSSYYTRGGRAYRRPAGGPASPSSQPGYHKGGPSPNGGFYKGRPRSKQMPDRTPNSLPYYYGSGDFVRRGRRPYAIPFVVPRHVLKGPVGGPVALRLPQGGIMVGPFTRPLRSPDELPPPESLVAHSALPSPQAAAAASSAAVASSMASTLSPFVVAPTSSAYIAASASDLNGGAGGLGTADDFGDFMDSSAAGAPMLLAASNMGADAGALLAAVDGVSPAPEPHASAQASYSGALRDLMTTGVSEGPVMNADSPPQAPFTSLAASLPPFSVADSNGASAVEHALLNTKATTATAAAATLGSDLQFANDVVIAHSMKDFSSAMMGDDLKALDAKENLLASATERSHQHTSLLGDALLLNSVHR